MKTEHIQRLLDRYRSGQSTESEIAEIESLISEGVIALEEVPDVSLLQHQVDSIAAPSPSGALDHRFYQMLSESQKKGQRSTWKHWFVWPDFAPKLALGSLMLFVGIAAGYLLRGTASDDGTQKIEVLSQQVSDLQEMMMLSMLEKGSTTERLKAVGLTREMDEASKQVTNALIKTLNQDENINVRLAALESLKPYVANSDVREALIHAIPHQESPLVQIALAELMVAIQEKSAVKEFKKIIESERTPSEVKKKIQQSIETLI